MEEKRIANIISNKKCNNNCLICTRAHMDLKEMKFEEVKEFLANLKSNGFNYIILTGGEPTFRDDLLEIIHLSKKLGFKKLQIQTNGRRFSDIEFTKNIISGNEEFIDIFLSIHGHNSELHEKITRVDGSFNETTLGIRNIIKFNGLVRTNTVISKLNYEFLYDIAKYLLSLKLNIIQFSFIHPNGEALKNFSLTIPNINDVIPYVKKALDIQKSTNGIKIFVEAIPFCLLEEYYIYSTEIILPESYLKADTKKTKSLECQNCRFFKTCPSIWSSYYLRKDFNFNLIIKN